jgi:hypothetical protein
MAICSRPIVTSRPASDADATPRGLKTRIGEHAADSGARKLEGQCAREPAATWSVSPGEVRFLIKPRPYNVTALFIQAPQLVHVREGGLCSRVLVIHTRVGTRGVQSRRLAEHEDVRAEDLRPVSGTGISHLSSTSQGIVYRCYTCPA